jgi:hypothetical protein
MKFGLIGDGYIAKYHKEAIKHIGGELVATYDPFDQDHKSIIRYSYPLSEVSALFFTELDYVVICSPSYLHYEQIKTALIYLPAGAKIICEKPAFLPWQPIIDDDRINIIMQLRNLILPKVDLVEIQMIRDPAYMESWKGKLNLSGGFIISLFIHYIDLAIDHKCRFVGRVLDRGGNFRFADELNLLDFEVQPLFDTEYKKILSGKGNKPKDLFYLYWVIGQLIQQYGPGQLCQQIEFDGARYGI